jgi:hypothetical protein
MNNSSVYLNIMTAINVLSLMMNIKDVSGHGRLIDPPSRSSAWRFGFNTTINYNDNELFCGGFNVSHVSIKIAFNSFQSIAIKSNIFIQLYKMKQSFE